ncbi:ABC transporter ATP-binding protein [Salinilacihabitans rarus]|uniref:ABC transporter ATP-binding protein n=1 Tax=Salinilacihabitans rarus TaxID=2961596 RepID=UPI0020C8AA7F|nr:ABC transporter ATP-binding protein [Salinilacihabitans rarus]
MEAVVAAEELRKTYGETVALAGVSLSVGRGEVFGLIGPNGAGKTTLVRALTGTTTPDAGAARILGESPAAVDRDRLGVLPQSFAPPERLTARELLAYYAGLYEDARDPDDVLADVGLADADDTWYEKLSGGQRRRVCVGTALVNDPDVLFLDEPTTGIDPAGRRTVWRLIEDLADAGTTVFLTTHDMAEAERLADRVGLLADGDLVAVGAPAALVAEHGGASRLVVETAADPDELAALGHPVEPRNDGLVVREVEPAEIGRVVDALDDRGIEYTGLSWTEPDLEDVYLALAGETERLRTARATAPSAAAPADAAAGGERR